ncbi:MAG: RsmG family class I SAM-dependent methyltransferase, partial [Candidatus Izemoplasmatales bacterium]|nr:RsmG family class I SAM-dependent methyltransferase [Candidatus Izemoplasmatales bacterium]
YDFVTARAVAKLNILSELALPFVKLNGYFIAYKSINYEEELQDALLAINKLGGKLENIYIYDINEEIKHTLIVIKKVQKTPIIYPRSFGKIKKSPL